MPSDNLKLLQSDFHATTRKSRLKTAAPEVVVKRAKLCSCPLEDVCRQRFVN
jgi:hypothetical protein